MKITVFDGGKGDCVLLQSAGGKNVLVDGGHVDPHIHRVFTYHENVAPTLGRLREAGEKLDLVCVSHIDQDHIGGVLSMLDDEFDWRVHLHQKVQGLDVEAPEHPRPPAIKAIWHNAFHEQLGMNRDAIEEALAAAAPLSLALGGGPASHGGDLFSRLATSMKEAAQVSRRIGSRQLGIPLNPQFDGKLVLRRPSSRPFRLGDLRITVLGPTPKRLEELRDKWDAWLRSTKGKQQIVAVQRQAGVDEDALISGGLIAYLALVDLGPAIGDRSTVTEENVASIVLAVEEAGKLVLMTGDARDDTIIDDLVDAGLADAEGRLHVDVLKIQHHGSENNFSDGFARRVTADHYLFCGNGRHENPDLRVVRRVLDSRVGPSSKRSPNPEAARRFKLWFTSDGSTIDAEPHHMDQVREIVESAHAANPGKFTYRFSGRRYFSFTL